MMDDNDFLQEYLDEQECPECAGELEFVDVEDEEYKCTECGWTTADDDDWG
jgi:hypothetical protein